MEVQETIRPESEPINKKYEIKKNNNKIIIEKNNDEIIFKLNIGISYYKYIKKYKFEEIKKELDLLKYKDINEVYKYLIKNEYQIINEEKVKKIIINNKEIKLEEKILKNEEIIKILIEEMNKQNEKINELIKKNEEKDNKIYKLKNKYNELKKEIYELEEMKKDKDINIIYKTEKEGKYNIFGKEFVENNEDNIELNINGKKSNLIGEYKLKKGENNIKMKIKKRITNFAKMFYYCDKLIDISELKYLNIKYSNNCKGMFCGCSSLTNI